MSPGPATPQEAKAGDAGLASDSLTVSPEASAHIRSYLVRRAKTDTAVRVAAVRSHCMGGAGFGYSIEEDAVRPGDMVVLADEVKFVVDEESMGHLRGARIDYEESLQGGGLEVRNPNAKGKCHCGRHDLLGETSDSTHASCH